MNKFNKPIPAATFDAATHEYTIRGRIVPSVTQVLDRAGLVDASWYTPAAAQRGTYVHEVCALFDRDELDWESIDESLKGYVTGWAKFRRLMPAKFDVIEEPFWSEEHCFGGTIDRAWNGIIGDIKTGAFPDWLALQLGGYSILRPATFACGIRLSSDGKFSMKNIAPYELGLARKQFLAALEKVKNENV